MSIPQTLSQRAYTLQDVVLRLNREVLPVVRATALRLTELGFEVELHMLGQRAIAEPEIDDFVKRELAPVLKSLIQQTNAMAGAQIVGDIGSRLPTDAKSLAWWLNRIVGPKLLVCRNAVILAT